MKAILRLVYPKSIIERKLTMNKKTSIIVSVMAVIGVITTAIVLCIVFRDRIKETYLYQRFFAENEIDDMDFFDDDFLDDDDPEEEQDKVDAEDEEEEKPTTKARRGYTSLKVS